MWSTFYYSIKNYDSNDIDKIVSLILLQFKLIGTYLPRIDKRYFPIEISNA